MKRFVTSTVVALVLGAAQVARAEGTCEPLSHPSKVRICVPTDWFHEVKDGSLRVKDQKEGWKVSLRLEPIDGANLEAALKKLDGKISDLVKVQWGKPKKLEKADPKNVNQMDGVLMSGPGKRKDTGADVRVLAALALTPTKQLVVVSLIGDSKWMSEAENANKVGALLNSFQPTE